MMSESLTDAAAAAAAAATERERERLASPSHPLHASPCSYDVKVHDGERERGSKKSKKNSKDKGSVET